MDVYQKPAREDKDPGSCCRKVESARMRTMDEILSLKERPVCSIRQNVPILDTLQLLVNSKAEALLFLEAGNLVTIVLEEGSNRRMTLAKKSLFENQIGEIMTKMVKYSTQEEAIEAYLAPKQELSVRHLPIMINGCLVGTISIDDYTRIILSGQVE